MTRDGRGGGSDKRGRERPPLSGITIGSRQGAHLPRGRRRSLEPTCSLRETSLGHTAPPVENIVRVLVVV